MPLCLYFLCCVRLESVSISHLLLCFVDPIAAITAVWQHYLVAPTAKFTVVPNSDSYGGMWGLNIGLYLPGTLMYACSVNTECGGVNGNGW